MTPIQVHKMWELLKLQIKLGIQYQYAKKPELGADPHTYTGLDCSAETRQLVYAGTNGQVIIPDGSYNQKDWCVSQGFHKVNYRNIGQYGHGRLFIAFFTNPNGIGHVWLVDGTTLKSMESHGHKGPDARDWDDGTLLRIVTSCYELPCTA